MLKPDKDRFLGAELHQMPIEQIYKGLEINVKWCETNQRWELVSPIEGEPLIVLDLPMCTC